MAVCISVCARLRAGAHLCTLQRAVLRSAWDHVALVVADRWGDPSSLALLEATGAGVSKYPLVPRLRAYGGEFTRRIAVRRLRVPRTKRLLRRLQVCVFVRARACVCVCWGEARGM